jgi:hypothetical protein
MKPPLVTLDALWLALPAALAMVLVGSMVEYPLDFWHHAATGRQITAGAIPDRDTFTYTIAGRPIVNQCWLAQWAIYALVRLGGFGLAQFVAAACYAAAIAVVTAATWRRCRSARVAAALALATLALTMSNLGVRPQAISFLLFAVELFALWQWPDRWPTVFLVGLVEVIWTNTHGAFPLGVVLPCLFLTAAVFGPWWDDPQSRSGRIGVLAACVVVALAAMFCNPHPTKTLGYVFNVTSQASQRGIEEWLPNVWIVLVAAAVGATILVLGRRRPQAIELLLFGVFGALALTSQRMIAWWAMVMAPALAPHLAALVAGVLRVPATACGTCGVRSRILNFTILLLLALVVAMSTPWTRARNPLLPPCKRQAHSDDEPWAAAEFLARSPYRGRAFSPMEWGAYLTWHFDPAIKVFIDGRVDFFPDDVWKDYQRIGRAAPGWQESLDRHSVELILWNCRLGALPAALSRSPRWKKVYEDDLAVIFVRAH